MSIMKLPVYIAGMEQITCQEPLSDSWMTSPRPATGEMVLSDDPDFRQWLSAADSRRMGKVLKRAVITTSNAMRSAGIDEPDAVIAATGFGCWKNTEDILASMATDLAGTAKPTAFMQSTHNTIASLLAIRNKWHGYNATHSNGPLSFECALVDAWTMLQTRQGRNILVGGFDELTPTLAASLHNLPAKCRPLAETSVAMLLTRDNTPGAPAITDIFFLPPGNERKIIDKVILAGAELLFTPVATNFPMAMIPVVPIFGYSYTVGAVGVYAAAMMLREGTLKGSPDCVAWVNCTPAGSVAVVINANS